VIDCLSIGLHIEYVSQGTLRVVDDYLLVDVIRILPFYGQILLTVPDDVLSLANTQLLKSPAKVPYHIIMRMRVKSHKCMLLTS
jgi:hypothetical protein